MSDNTNPPVEPPVDPGRPADTTPWLPTPTEVDQEHETEDGRVFKAVEQAGGGPGHMTWVELIFESPDGRIRYDPPQQRLITHWYAAEARRALVEVPDLPGPEARAAMMATHDHGEDGRPVGYTPPEPPSTPQDELDIRFTYVAPTEEQAERMASIRQACGDLAQLVEALTPGSREQSLALTRIEEVSMWANAAIARREAQE